jgi:hypothetical protein
MFCPPDELVYVGTSHFPKLGRCEPLASIAGTFGTGTQMLKEIYSDYMTAVLQACDLAARSHCRHGYKVVGRQAQKSIKRNA